MPRRCVYRGRFWVSPWPVMTAVFLIPSPNGAESRQDMHFLHLNKSGSVAGVHLTTNIWRWWNWIFLNFYDAESDENRGGWSSSLLNWESSQRGKSFNNYSASVKGGFCQAAAPAGSDCPRLLREVARAGSIWCFSELRLCPLPVRAGLWCSWQGQALGSPTGTDQQKGAHSNTGSTRCYWKTSGKISCEVLRVRVTPIEQMPSWARQAFVVQQGA